MKYLFLSFVLIGASSCAAPSDKAATDHAAVSSRSQRSPNTPRVGFSGCNPGLFFNLKPGMTVTFSEITYANSGMLKNFAEEVREGDGPRTSYLITVDLGRWTGMCSTLAYTVQFSGQTLQSPPFDSFSTTDLPGTIAFSPEDGTGILIGGGALEGDLVTEFGHDAKGREFISRQVFALGQVKYEVKYSGYSYAGPPTGKLSGFTASISTLVP